MALPSFKGIGAEVEALPPTNRPLFAGIGAEVQALPTANPLFMGVGAEVDSIPLAPYFSGLTTELSPVPQVLFNGLTTELFPIPNVQFLGLTTEFAEALILGYAQIIRKRFSN